MTVGEPETPRAASSRAKDHSPWNWLLFVPIVVPLIPVLFNADSPRLFGFPASTGCNWPGSCSGWPPPRWSTG